MGVREEKRDYELRRVYPVGPNAVVVRCDLYEAILYTRTLCTCSFASLFLSAFIFISVGRSCVSSHKEMPLSTFTVF